MVDLLSDQFFAGHPFHREVVAVAIESPISGAPFDGQARTSAVPVLEARGVTKRFAGVTALDSVDFAVRPGESLALMGENGAGKSTLIKVLTGV